MSPFGDLIVIPIAVLSVTLFGALLASVHPEWREARLIKTACLGASAVCLIGAGLLHAI